ncbi:O-antigen ligase family protein [Noviherbaspirillum massiliense]|uniref:O-antigen ligase family protein n=1 Tax=Noviherbaspirillum massiliense TaxID=1465823 RepID=UPI0003132004|nr:O-antigen ligase family protein [Noviherbaspirillum massiliense]
MNSGEIFQMLASLGGAAVLGLGCMVGIGWFISLQRHSRKWLLALVYPIIIFAISLGPILSNRNVSNADFESVATQFDTQLLTWFFRLTTGFIFGICLARFISVSQRYEHRPRHGRGLFLAFLAYYISNVILNNIFGTHPEFYERFLPSMFLFAAVYFSRNQYAYFSVEATKRGLLFFIAASCLTAVVLPSVSVQRDYAGYFPGLDIRFWGLGVHPNSTGPLAIVFLLLIICNPFRRRWLQLASYAMGIGTLLLAQSKTAWVAALVAFGLLWWYRYIQAPTGGRSRRRAYYSLRDFAAPMFVCLAGLSVVAAIAIFSGYDQHFAQIDQERQLTTLTGRTEIWEIALEVWKNNPLFGYGSSVWGTEFRRAIGNDAAVSAHSQYLQALSEAGTVGFVGLVVYLVMLWRHAAAANRATGGLSLAMFSILLVRSFTETPFDMTTIFTGEFVAHLLLFRLALIASPKPKLAPYPQSQHQFQMG